MANSYTRQSTSNIATGLVINAADFNAEFNKLVDAFSASAGHTHSGNAQEGGRITVFGQAGELLGTSANVIKPNSNNTVDLGASSAKFKDFYLDGIAFIDTLNLNGTAITSTGAELNIIDGGTSATSTTLADADRLIVNDNGTMVQVALTDFETYFESALDTLSNVTTVGALASGSIASGFGAITTTNTITFGTLSDGTTDIAGFKDEDDMSSDSNTHVPTQQSVKAYVDSQVTAQDLDFQADSGGALSIDLDSETLTFTGGTGIDTSGSGNAVTFAIDSTVATLTGSQTLTNKTLTTPIIEEIDSSGTITLDATTDIILDADGGDVFLKDAGSTYGSLTNTSGNLIIKSGTTTALTFAGANATFAGNVAVGNLLLDTNSLTSTNTNGDITITPNGNGKIVLDGLNFPIADGNANEVLQTNGSGQLSFTAINTDLSADSSPQLGGNLDLNSSNITGTGNINITGGITISGNLTVNGTTTTVNSTTVTIDDPIFTLGGDTAPSSDDNKDRGIEFRYHTGTTAKVGFFGYDDSASKFTFIADATNSSEVFSGNAGDVVFGGGTFTSLDAGTGSVTTGNIVSTTDSTYNIGTTSNRYANVYADSVDSPVLKATNASSGTTSIQIGASDDWTVEVGDFTINSSAKTDALVFKYNGTAKFAIDTSGNFTAVGDVTASGTIS
tara:strand:- start:12372 stop:14399 length:2028 start_codon:yes stop_codon:yes gene_type:complete